jgi:hypothetical protein
MVSAGSVVPNRSRTFDFLGTRAASQWRRWVAAPLVVLPCLLQGCSETKSILTGDSLLTGSASYGAASAPADTFAARFAAAENFPSAPGREASASRTRAVPVGSAEGAYKVASLSPDVPYGLPAIKQGQTQLVGFENSAFPYHGKSGSRYSDNRVLVHVPLGFDVRKPGVIVVFFHGHGATLARDVRDRQLLPAQISESGVNAVLVAPQLAYDAADSSAGKFWERGGLKRFMAEAAENLARVYGDPRAAAAFAKMPVILVGYSGGFVATASSLQVGGLGRRVKGVVLLDALYGELDKFSGWIVKNRSAFFVSAYTPYTKRHDDELARTLRDKGIPVVTELNGPLKPGSVAFIATRGGINHRDYVTLAWTQHPVTDMLLRLPRI